MSVALEVFCALNVSSNAQAVHLDACLLAGECCEVFRR